MAGNMGGHNQVISDFEEPLNDVAELRAIAPTDLKQSFDIRSIISRIVDGSEFDEFKKLYGTVRHSNPHYLSCAFNIYACVCGYISSGLQWYPVICPFVFLMNRHL